jgi:hypothetical protein
MEFDELQQIWDAQNSQPLYAINEEALHHRIQSKMKQARKITHISELLIIIMNLGAGSLVLAFNLFKQRGNISMYLLAGWMLATALYSLVGRIRRIKGNHRFDRSMQGDLRHAISLATYQVRLSGIMRWNMLPIAALTLLGMWEGEKPFWIAGFLLIFFALAWYASNWEYSIYKNRKRELEVLQTKLERN